MSMEEALELVGAALLIVAVFAFVIHFYLRNPDRSTAMRNAARKIGFRYRPAGDLALRDRLPALSIFGTHYTSHFLSVLEGTWKGAEMVVFDCQVRRRFVSSAFADDDGTEEDAYDYDSYPDGGTGIDLFGGGGSVGYTTVVAMRIPDSVRDGRYIFGAWTIEYQGEWGAAFTRTGDAFAGTTHVADRAPWVDPAELPAYVEEAVSLIQAPDGSKLLERG